MSEVAEAAPRRRLSEADRDRLLRQAALGIFLRDGYTAARMDDVAQAAGMSKRTLYQNYASKALLFEAVMQDSLCPVGIDPAAEAEPDLATALRSMLASVARHLFEPQQVAIFRLIIAEVRRAPELADAFHRAGPGRGASSIERRLATEIESGRLRLTDARQAARMLFGAAIGAAHMFLLLGLNGPPTEAEIERLAGDAVEIFLRGALVAATG